MIYMANIWPAAVRAASIETILEILSAHCIVIQTKEIHLNYLGLRNYMLQIYKAEKWSGSYWNHFRGIKVKLDACYEEGSIWVIELESPDKDSVLQAKEAVRKFCRMEKSSIHTTDTKEEAEMMRNLLYHKKNCELMNSSRPDKYYRFTSKLNILEKLCRAEAFSTDDLVIVSDAVLALYNIRPSGKLSFLSRKKLPPRLARYNDREYENASKPYREEIFHPGSQVTFCGFRFITPLLLDKIRNKMSDKVYL